MEAAVERRVGSQIDEIINPDDEPDDEIDTFGTVNRAFRPIRNLLLCTVFASAGGLV